MRLGVSLDIKSDDPEVIARAYLAAGYSAAGCPPVSLDQPERIRAIGETFSRYDLCLAEVGVWNNMLDPDPVHRAANLEINIQKLALADEIGALCCVNIAGSFNPARWDGPDPRNLSEQAFELTVENVRKIIDAVKPKRTLGDPRQPRQLPEADPGRGPPDIWRAPGPREYDQLPGPLLR